MMSSDIPHVLFVLDKIPAHAGGIYAVVKWIITRIQNWEHQHARLVVKISCTSYYPKHDAENNGRKDPAFNGVHIIYASIPARQQSQATLRQLIDQNKIDTKARVYFKDLSVFDGVSHIVLIAHKTDKSSLPEVIERERDGKVKVIVLANVSTLKTREVEILRQDTSVDFLCVGTRVHYDCVMKTKSFRHSHPVCVFPTSLNLARRARRSTGFSVLTLYNEYNRFPIAKGPRGEDCKFLETLARSLGKMLRDIRLLEKTRKIEWCIHLPSRYYDDEREGKLKQNLRDVANVSSSLLEITFNSDSDISTLAHMYTLCVQPGYFDLEGYSGLETILCGIPTLVVDGSDVANMIKSTVDSGLKKYFTLESFESSSDPSSQWAQTLLDVFLESEMSARNFDYMFAVMDRYLDSDDVHRGAHDMLGLLTGAY